MNVLDSLPEAGVPDPLKARQDPGGRPTKFTEETRGKILTALKGGNYREVACRYAGVSYQTFRNWLKNAEDPSNPPEFLEFLAAVEKAEADAEVADLALIRRAAQDGSWTAAAWVRERKNPERWGRKDRTAVELTGADGGPLDVRVKHGVDTIAIEGLALALARRAAALDDQTVHDPTTLVNSDRELSRKRDAVDAEVVEVERDAEWP